MTSGEYNRSLTIVIPAYNEVESLPRLIPDLVKYCAQYGWKIIIVNDGSTDGTREYLSDLNQAGMIRVFHHKVNRGYGGALKTGLSIADTDYVITFDADGQHNIGNIESLVNKRVEVDADLVIGWRQNVNSMDVYRSFGKRIISLIARILLQVKLHDLNSGMKLYSTKLVRQYLPLCPNSMAFSDIITLIFVSEGHLVVEAPIEIKRRRSGKSTITTYTAMETMLEIINIAMLFNPLRFFLPISFFFILLGMVWGLPIALNGRGISVGAMMAIVIGVIIFFLGLVAEQLSQLRRGIIKRFDMDKDNDWLEN